MGIYFRKGIWIALICWAITAAALWGWSYLGAEAKALAADGRAVQGIIVDRRESTTRGSKGRTRHHYYLAVEFDPGDGVRRVERGVDHDYYEGQTLGGAIEVRFLPSDPDIIEIEPGALAGKANAAGWVALVSALIGAGAAWLIHKAVLAHRGLVARGVRTTGIVTSVSVRKGKRKLAFSFTDNRGMGHSGSGDPVSVAKVGPPPAPGSSIEILYDPQNPRAAQPVDQFEP